MKNTPVADRATRPASASCHHRTVRMVRKVEPGQAYSQAGRMLLSGSIGDICAQIDHLLAQEPAQAELWSQSTFN